MLIERPLPPAKKLFQLQTGEPKPRGLPRKNALEKCPIAEPIGNGKASNRIHVENVTDKVYDKDELAQAIMQTKRMRIRPPCDPKPRTDLDETSGKNLLGDGLVRSAYEFAKSVTETSSKVQEPKTYDEVINDLIHKNR